MKCTICSHEVRAGSAACPRCGAPLTQAAPEWQADEKTVMRSGFASQALRAETLPSGTVGPALAPPVTPSWNAMNSVSEPSTNGPALAPATPADVPPSWAPVYVAQPAAPPQNMIVLANRKSVAVALVLTFFFGPLGMFYSTVAGALIMLAVSIVGALLTGGISLFLTGPACMVWGAVAASQANAKVMQQVRGW